MLAEAPRRQQCLACRRPTVASTRHPCTQQPNNYLQDISHVTGDVLESDRSEHSKKRTLPSARKKVPRYRQYRITSCHWSASKSQAYLANICSQAASPVIHQLIASPASRPAWWQRCGLQNCLQIRARAEAFERPRNAPLLYAEPIQ